MKKATITNNVATRGSPGAKPARKAGLETITLAAECNPIREVVGYAGGNPIPANTPVKAALIAAN
jgi:hypothetical protein